MKELKNERINTMKAIMKTMKRNIANVKVMGYRLWVMGLLLWLALPTMAQPQTFNGATAPQSTFQSTNTMMGSGSRYASQPRLSTRGQAIYSTMGSTSGPRRAKKADLNGDGFDDETGTPVNPNPWGEHGEQTVDNTDPNSPGTPIGDAVLPLTLMCLLAAGVVYLRRRRAS